MLSGKDTTVDRENEIRLALPSKGILAEASLELLAEVGLHVYKPNPRQYRATIPSLPGLTVLFQRPGDIVVSVRDGSVDFGITGWDVVAERRGSNGDVLVIHPGLGFGHCSLNVIVPETWDQCNTMADLPALRRQLGRPLRVATKFPNLSRAFFDRHDLPDVELIFAEGTLEIAPTIGYADLIVDLVSTGTTLRDNRLKNPVRWSGLAIASLPDCQQSPACIQPTGLEHCQAIARIHRRPLARHGERLDFCQYPRRFTGKHCRADVHPIRHRRASRTNALARHHPAGEKWYATNLIVRKDQLVQAIAELRQVGGSGVVVTPVTYIFEEEPEEITNMLAALEAK